MIVNRYRPDRRDRVEWAKQLRTDYGAHLVEPIVVPEREVIAAAATAAAPLSTYGPRIRDATDALAAIAARVLPTTVPA